MAIAAPAATQAAEYCAPFKPPLFDQCMLVTEWSALWSAAGTAGTLLFGTITAVAGVFGIWKIRYELRNLREQRAKETAIQADAQALRRTQFFLDQHRRLFADGDLADVLQHIDDDNKALADPAMSDKKRKFLTFFEEIALLVNSNQIKAEVAYYMFGYYARCARAGANFNENIDTSEEHWKLFQTFAEESGRYVAANPNGPGAPLSL